MAVLGIWYWSERTISVNTVTSPKVEGFYSTAITFSQTLGTALGDWLADTGGLGYEGGALVFGAGLLVLVAAYYWTNISPVGLFWAAFILTRPLGATVGDFLDKPVSHGGLNLSRPLASAVIAVFIIGCIILLPQRAGTHPGAPKAARSASLRQLYVSDITYSAIDKRYRPQFQTRTVLSILVCPGTPNRIVSTLKAEGMRREIQKVNRTDVYQEYRSVSLAFSIPRRK